MKMTDVRKLSDKELDKKLNSLKDDLVSFKRDRFTTDEKNVNKARGLRRDIARLLTEKQSRLGSQSSDDDQKETE